VIQLGNIEPYFRRLWRDRRKLAVNRYLDAGSKGTLLVGVALFCFSRLRCFSIRERENPNILGKTLP
jgi:hypothetical protein